MLSVKLREKAAFKMTYVYPTTDRKFILKSHIYLNLSKTKKE